MCPSVNGFYGVFTWYNFDHESQMGMIQENYDIIDVVSCKVEAKQFA